MALAAKEGGADGIRANGIADIRAIQDTVDLPIIGIIKKNYGAEPVYITPTIAEVDELTKAGVDVIALDATGSNRPTGESLKDFFREIKTKYPSQVFMADCSTLKEMQYADQLGFDFIGTTMVGYTKQSKNILIAANDFELVKEAVRTCQHPVICEGNIDTPEKAGRVMQLGIFGVVVGGAITRPQLITRRFKTMIEEKNHE
jgi:N-acylglucosamine-6-phosphate 2-epimerase